MNKYLAVLFCFIMSNSAIAQNSVKDSLLNLLSKTKIDTTKINILNELSYEVVEVDTALAHKYAGQALKLSVATGYSKGMITAYYNIAYVYELLYKQTVAEGYYLKGISLANQKLLPGLAAFGCQNYAVLLKKQRKFKQALQTNMQAIHLYQRLKDTIHLALVYTNVGNCYSNLNLPALAITYHINSLKLNQQKANNAGITKAYNNIAIVYERSGNFEKALENYQRMLPSALATGKKNLLAAANGNIGSAYQNLKQQTKALPYILKAVKQHAALGDKARVALNLNNLAACYNDLHLYAKAYQASLDALRSANEANDQESAAYAYITAGTAMSGLKHYNEARQLMDTAYSRAQQVGSPAILITLYAQAVNLYKTTGNYKKVVEFSDRLMALKDSTYDAEKHAQIAALQEQYESQQKDKQLAQSALADAKNKEQISRKNRLLRGLGASLAILAVVAGLVLRNMRLKSRKLKSDKALTEAEAEQGLLNEKLRISSELHDNIGSQLTFIHSSIQVMRHMQGNNDLLVLKETEEITAKTIRDLRQTVWFINNTTFTADDFAIRLREYAKPYLSVGSTAVVVNTMIPESVRLSSAMATHLFRIVQEAINNAIKYANASDILIDLRQNEAGEVAVSISDNGIGFDTCVISAGFGLRSMEARAKNIGGCLSVKSAPGKGTCIQISVPLL